MFPLKSHQHHQHHQHHQQLTERVDPLKPGPEASRATELLLSSSSPPSSPPLSIMDAGRVSDFSIERILGHKPEVTEVPPDGYLRGIPGGFSLDCGGLRAAAPPVQLPVQLPVPAGCLQYRGPFYQHSSFSGVYPNSGVYVHFSSQEPADAQSLPGYHGYHQAGVSAQPHLRQKSRMRTVFTDSQTKRLEALFELTDYPAVEARAEVARSTGLSEETVRVWFKNRRARRKRQRSGSKVKSPQRGAGAEKLLFTSFL